MLTVKEINEVSFGKAGFSGYKPEDVDNFIDEVVESFTQLLAERDDALQQEAQLDQQVKELTNQVAQLKAKNAELQKKLGILAQKIESYREEEDGIKEAILSAQKIGKDAIQEAKDKAAVMLADAEENAKALLANARDDAAKAAREYAIQVEQKRNELEEMKRQVSAFRVSLLEMYKSTWRASTTSPASVLRIPSRLFPARSLSPLPSRSQSRNPSPSTGRSPGPSLRLSRSRNLSQSRSLCPSLWWSSPKWSLPPRDPRTSPGGAHSSGQSGLQPGAASAGAPQLSPG